MATIAIVTAMAMAGFFDFRRDEAPAISDALYARWRTECSTYATETIDTRLHAIGGVRWTEVVNGCLVTKAGDSP